MLELAIAALLATAPSNPETVQPEAGDAASVPAPASELPPGLLAPPAVRSDSELKAERSPERTWYGYQLIISDVITGGLAVAGGAIGAAHDCGLDSFNSQKDICVAMNVIKMVAAGGFVFAPVVLHGVHGQEGAAARSFVLRLVVPVVAGFATAWATGQGPRQFGTGSSNAPETVALVAAGVGAIIDDAFLSFGPARALPDPRN